MQQLPKFALNEKHSGIAYSFSAVIPEILGLIIMLVATMICRIVGTDAAALNDNEAYLWTLVFASQLAFFLVALYIFRRGKVGFQSEMRIVKPDASYTALGLIFTVGLMFFISPIVTMMVSGLESIGYVPGGVMPDVTVTHNFIIAIFVIGILPAICEEILFRGIILGGLKGFGGVFAILMTSLLFMLMHKSLEQTVYQFLFAIALGYVAIKTGSVVVPILMHMLNNLIIICLEYAGVFGVGVLAWEWIAMGVGGAIAAACVVYEFVIRKRRVTAEDVAGRVRGKKSVFFAYAAVGIAFNAVMFIINIFI